MRLPLIFGLACLMVCGLAMPARAQAKEGEEPSALNIFQELTWTFDSPEYSRQQILQKFEAFAHNRKLIRQPSNFSIPEFVQTAIQMLKQMVKEDKQYAKKRLFPQRR